MAEKTKKKNKKIVRKNNSQKTEPRMIVRETDADNTNRVAVIGCGNVGMASAFALLQSRLVRELILIDRDSDIAQGEAMDLQQAIAVPMESPVKVTAGGYNDAAASSIVIITAGVATDDPNVSRLEL